jgi:hypothetical protein
VTGVTTLITDQFPLISTKSPVIADDVNNDGTADYLYYKGYRADVYFVCNPASATPYADILVNYGPGTSSNYGLGLDRVNNRLYAWEYTTKQIVMID